MSRTEGHPNRQQAAAALLETIRALSKELHPEAQPSVTLASSLDRDLGFDSLARMELLARIEKAFGVALAEQAVIEAETPDDLLSAILGAETVPSPGAPAAAEREVSSGGRISDPQGARTLLEVLDWHLDAHPGQPHVHFYADEGKGEPLSYQGLRRGAEGVAAGLQKRGLAPGETVSIMLPSGPEYFYAFFGVVLAGGVPVPIYPPVRMALLEDHLRRQLAILSNCGAAILITFAEAVPFARLLKSQLASLTTLVTVADLTEPSGAWLAPDTRAGDTAFLQYTSGSTGYPKGVVLSHANLLTNIRAMGKAVRVTDSDVIVSWLPLYHDMGLIGTWLACLYFGIPLVLLSPLDFLARPKRWLWAIHQYRGTLSPAPNFAYEICITRLPDEDLEGLDLSSWRAAFNGAEPVSPATLERFCRRFEGYGFRRGAMMPVYGLAECSVGLAFPPCDRGPRIDRIVRESFVSQGRARPAAEGDEGAMLMPACGPPLEGHEIRIVDPDGRELPERREGRVQFRGPSATSGYFRNPAETERLFDGGWLDTGDLGYIAGGELYISGRIKDLIIIAGRNIYPQELEEAVGNIPGVRKGNVVVFGSTSGGAATERMVVVAETRESDSAGREKLRSAINALALELVGTPVDDLVLAPPRSLLKTSSGKLRRAACRDRYERGQLGKTEKSWRMYLRIGGQTFVGWWRRLRQRGADRLYSYAMRTVFWLVAPPVWLAVVALPSSKWRWRCMRASLRLVRGAGRIPLRVRGAEHLPQGRPCVVVANHGSYLDGLVLVAALPWEFSFVAKAELQEGRFSEPFLRSIGSEFVERFDKRKGLEDARRIGRRLRRGRPLVFFPEGTFTRAPGLRPFHMGAFVAAAEAGVPVVPVAISGTRSILRGDDKHCHHGAISVEIGEPIEVEKDDQVGDWKRAVMLRDLARSKILEGCGEPDLGREGP